jgi:hypothetical protein
MLATLPDRHDPDDQPARGRMRLQIMEGRETEIA